MATSQSPRDAQNFIVEIDGVPQIGLKFGSAERAATLLNTFKETPEQEGKRLPAKTSSGRLSLNHGGSGTRRRLSSPN